MKKVVIFSLLILLMGLATSEIGYDNPNLPGLVSDTTAGTRFDNASASVNMSTFWGPYLYSDYNMPLIKSFAYNQTQPAIDFFLNLAPIIVQHSNGSINLYKPSANTDSARGIALLSAFGNSSNGDTIYLSTGNFAIGNNNLRLKPNMSFYGSGMENTIITSTATIDLPEDGGTGAIVNPGNNTVIGYMAIMGISVPDMATGFQVPFGYKSNLGDNVPTRFVAKELKLIADTDGFFFWGNTTTNTNASIYNCIVQTKYDGIVFNYGGGNFNFYNTKLEISGPSATELGSSGLSQYQNNNSPLNIRFMNGDISVKNGNVENYGVHTQDITATGIIEVYNTKIDVSGTNAFAIAQFEGPILVGNSIFNTSKSFTNIIYSDANPTVKSIENSSLNLTTAYFLKTLGNTICNATACFTLQDLNSTTNLSNYYNKSEVDNNLSLYVRNNTNGGYNISAGKIQVKSWLDIADTPSAYQPYKQSIAVNSTTGALMISGLSNFSSTAGSLTIPVNIITNINPLNTFNNLTGCSGACYYAGGQESFTLQSLSNGVAGTKGAVSVGKIMEGRFLGSPFTTWNSTLNYTVIGGVSSTYTTNIITQIGANVNYIGHVFPVPSSNGVSGTKQLLSFVAESDVLHETNTRIILEGDYNDGTTLVIGDSYMTKNITQAQTEIWDDGIKTIALNNSLVNISGNLEIDGNLSVKRPYGMFSSTETETIAVASTAYPVWFNYTEDAYLITRDVTNNNTFRVLQTGDYLIEVSAIMSVDTPNKHAELWVKKNGADVPRSNTRMELTAATSEIPLAVPFIIDLNTTDTLQFYWASDDAGTQMVATAATAYSPASPSIIVTFTKNSEITP